MKQALIALLVCAGLAGPGAAVARSPNVMGTLTPVAASGRVCPDDDPCDPPATARVLRFSQGGRIIRAVRVTARGTFSLYLAPGRYRISTAPLRVPEQTPHVGSGSVTPSTVRVPSHGVVHLRLSEK